jgi:hypothetical protein
VALIVFSGRAFVNPGSSTVSARLVLDQIVRFAGQYAGGRRP